MQITDFAENLCQYLKTLPQVKSCRLYGSLVIGNFDMYSDADIELDVSGTDNSQFLLGIPEMLSKRFPVLFCDYAPSLAPEKYLVTVAIRSENPFMLADIACTANPFYKTVSQQDLKKLNNNFDHILKLFSANLKHYLRGMDCRKDIHKMYQKFFSADPPEISRKEMLNKIYHYLLANAPQDRLDYLRSFERYIGQGAGIF